MRILNATQIREWDQFTIEHEPIASIDLMERASLQVFQWIQDRYPSAQPVCVLCGPGNNGGDGLAVARMLYEAGFPVRAYLMKSANPSPDCLTNQDRLAPLQEIQELSAEAGMPEFLPDELVLDALLGSGLTRPLDGYLLELVEFVNASGLSVIAVDIATGLFDEKPMENATAIRPKVTLTFEVPKLNFLFPSTAAFVGDLQVLPIGLHPGKTHETDFHVLTKEFVRLPSREKFGHKGSYGHALFVAGKKGSMGAAMLGAEACLRSGVGLLTCHVPQVGESLMQLRVPEAMVHTDTDPEVWTENGSLEKYAAIGIGPGIGQHAATRQALGQLLQQAEVPLVLDADALNILAQAPEFLLELPDGCILTPHPKELERLIGPTSSDGEQLEKTREFAQRIGAVVLIKRAHTAIALPDGTVFFNSTGNPGMGTAGSGDVLTGILTALLAQGFEASEAAKIGVYVHGLAGDLAAEEKGEVGLIARDLVEMLPKALLRLIGSR